MLNKEQRTPAGGVIPRALAPPGSPVPGARVLLLPEAGDRPPVFTFSLLGSSLTTDACFPKQRATRFAAFLMRYRLMNGGCKTSSFELFPLPDVLLTRRTAHADRAPCRGGGRRPARGGKVAGHGSFSSSWPWKELRVEPDHGEVHCVKTARFLVPDGLGARGRLPSPPPLRAPERALLRRQHICDSVTSSDCHLLVPEPGAGAVASRSHLPCPLQTGEAGELGTSNSNIYWKR